MSRTTSFEKLRHFYIFYWKCICGKNFEISIVLMFIYLLGFKIFWLFYLLYVCSISHVFASLWQVNLKGCFEVISFKIRVLNTNTIITQLIYRPDNSKYDDATHGIFDHLIHSYSSQHHLVHPHQHKTS